MKCEKTKNRVLSIRPDAIIFESQIQFQKTYNIRSNGETLGSGFTKADAWNMALKNLL